MQSLLFSFNDMQHGAGFLCAQFYDPILYEDVRSVLIRAGPRPKEVIDVVMEWASAVCRSARPPRRCEATVRSFHVSD